MQYDFYEKGIGSEEAIDEYWEKNGFIYASWNNGRYELKGYLEDLYWEEQWINCDYFYNKWDKKWYNKVQKVEIYEK